MPHRLVATPSRAWLTAMLCAALMLGACALAGYSFSVAHANGCASRNASLAVLADVLALSKPTPAELAHMSPERRRHARAFFRAAAKRIDEAHCS